MKSAISYTRGLRTAALVPLLFLLQPSGAAAQNRYPAQPAPAQQYPSQLINSGESRTTLTCTSIDRSRTFCTADTRGGVRLLRQLGEAPCNQGSSWDYDSRGVWVDLGCQAEFSLSPGNPPDLPPTLSGSIPAGTSLTVRTNERIDTRRSDGLVYSAIIELDVLDDNGSLAIPRGSQAELLIRTPSPVVLVLDLDSVTVNGQRYALSAAEEQISGRQQQGVGSNERTAKFVGGGALLGTLLGAIAGGGKGAAIGAAAGAGAGVGAQVLTRGSSVKVPSESILTFRLDRPLQVGQTDRGTSRRGRHYHQLK